MSMAQDQPTLGTVELTWEQERTRARVMELVVPPWTASLPAEELSRREAEITRVVDRILVWNGTSPAVELTPIIHIALYEQRLDELHLLADPNLIKATEEQQLLEALTQASPERVPDARRCMQSAVRSRLEDIQLFADVQRMSSQEERQKAYNWPFEIDQEVPLPQLYHEIFAYFGIPEPAEDGRPRADVLPATLREALAARGLLPNDTPERPAGMGDHDDDRAQPPATAAGATIVPVDEQRQTSEATSGHDDPYVEAIRAYSVATSLDNALWEEDARLAFAVANVPIPAGVPSRRDYKRAAARELWDALRNYNKQAPKEQQVGQGTIGGVAFALFPDRPEHAQDEYIPSLLASSNEIRPETADNHGARIAQLRDLVALFPEVPPLDVIADVIVRQTPQAPQLHASATALAETTLAAALRGYLPAAALPAAALPGTPQRATVRAVAEATRQRIVDLSRERDGRAYLLGEIYQACQTQGRDDLTRQVDEAGSRAAAPHNRADGAEKAGQQIQAVSETHVDADPTHTDPSITAIAQGIVTWLPVLAGHADELARIVLDEERRRDTSAESVLPERTQRMFAGLLQRGEREPAIVASYLRHICRAQGRTDLMGALREALVEEMQTRRDTADLIQHTLAKAAAPAQLLDAASQLADLALPRQNDAEMDVATMAVALADLEAPLDALRDLSPPRLIERLQALCQEREQFTLAQPIQALLATLKQEQASAYRELEDRLYLHLKEGWPHPSGSSGQLSPLDASLLATALIDSLAWRDEQSGVVLSHNSKWLSWHANLLADSPDDYVACALGAYMERTESQMAAHLRATLPSLAQAEAPDVTTRQCASDLYRRVLKEQAAYSTVRQETPVEHIRSRMIAQQNARRACLAMGQERLVDALRHIPYLKDEQWLEQEASADAVGRGCVAPTIARAPLAGALREAVESIAPETLGAHVAAVPAGERTEVLAQRVWWPALARAMTAWGSTVPSAWPEAKEDNPLMNALVCAIPIERPPLELTIEGAVQHVAEAAQTGLFQHALAELKWTALETLAAAEQAKAGHARVEDPLDEDPLDKALSKLDLSPGEYVAQAYASMRVQEIKRALKAYLAGQNFPSLPSAAEKKMAITIAADVRGAVATQVQADIAELAPPRTETDRRRIEKVVSDTVSTVAKAHPKDWNDQTVTSLARDVMETRAVKEFVMGEQARLRQGQEAHAGWSR